MNEQDALTILLMDTSNLRASLGADHMQPETLEPKESASWEEVREVICPKCGAGKGKQCENLNNPMHQKDEPHKERALRYFENYVQPKCEHGRSPSESCQFCQPKEANGVDAIREINDDECDQFVRISWSSVGKTSAYDLRVWARERTIARYAIRLLESRAPQTTLEREVQDLRRQMRWMHTSCEPDNCHTSGENCTGGARWTPEEVAPQTAPRDPYER